MPSGEQGADGPPHPLATLTRRCIRPSPAALERVAALEPRQGRGTRIITEANLFGRFVRVVKSYANTIVTGLEDPEKVRAGDATARL